MYGLMSTFIHFKYIIINTTILKCYNSECYVLHMVLSLSYCDDCSVIHQMYNCPTIPDNKCY